MTSTSPTLRVLRYRGNTSYEVKWTAAGEDHVEHFDTEAHANELIAKLNSAKPAASPSSGAKTPVSPPPAPQSPETQPPFGTVGAPGPEEVAFAAAKLKAIGIDLRSAITEYSYAHKLLQKSGLSVLDAVRQLVDASFELKDTGVDFSSAIFEYVEAHRQTEGVALSEVVRQYKRSLKQAGSAPETKPIVTREEVPERPSPAKTSVSVEPPPLARPPVQAQPAAPAQPPAPSKPAAQATVGSKPTISIPKLLELFVVLKAKTGIDEEEIADIRQRLNRFAVAFPGQATHELFFGNESWFNQLDVSESSRQKLRSLIREIGQFALQSGFRL